MRHIGEGKLRAFYDDALPPAERTSIEQHLATCARCARDASVVQERAVHVATILSRLEPGRSVDPVTPRLARGQLEAYERRREEVAMARNPLSRRYRLTWVATTLALLTLVILAVSPVRSLAGDLLGVFRVQKITFKPVDTEALPDKERLEALAPEIERMFGDMLAVGAERRPIRVTKTSARERAEFTVRLPTSRDAGGYEWTPPFHVAMQIDVERLQALFTELGYQIELPHDLDGKTLEAAFSGMLTSYYGSCEGEHLQSGCVTLVQMASPSISVPDGLDIDQLGRIYLELLGTPAEEAWRLSQQIDWTTTLVLPFPHHVNLTHDTVIVDGVQATLIHSQSDYRPATEYLLSWVKDGVVYGVVGDGAPAEALELAETLQ